jgi:hypothetical protein
LIANGSIMAITPKNIQNIFEGKTQNINYEKFEGTEGAITN